MTEVRRIDPETGFIREFKEIAARVGSLETKPSGNIVIRETLTATDPETGVKTIIGQLPDGTVGFQPFVGDIVPPPVATVPVATAQPGTITVSWDGNFVGGAEKPNDFQHVNVKAHKIVTGTTVLSLTVGVIRLTTESVIITTDVLSYGETWEFSLESEDYNGNRAALSARSAPVAVLSGTDDSTVGAALADLTTATQTAQTAANTAQTAANTAQSAADAAAVTANSKGKTIIQSAAPAAADQLAQNLWIDTTGGANTPKRWDGTAWVIVTDKVATDAATAAGNAQTKADQAFNNAASASTAAGNAQTTADGKNRSWYQTTAPAGTGHKNGDQWFDTDDGNKLYLWTGAAWVVFQDAAIAAAQSTANAAVTSANGKNTNYYQTTQPSGGTYISGDIWFDTDDNYKMYTYTGSVWQLTQDSNTALTTANSKVKTYVQGTAPTATATGDLWIDTANGNQIKRWSGSVWVDVRDTTIAAAQGTADTALTSANGKNKVYYQTAMPTGGTYIVGDTWFDTDDGNKIYVHNGTTFVNAQDTAIAAAQSTANTKTKTYFQTASPGTTGNTTGDIWFDTDDGNKPYVWNGSAWTVAQDAAIATAQTAANTAQTSANGKNKVYYQTTMPTGGTYILGDTWFDTDDGNKIYVHNGTTFVASQDTAIATVQALAGSKGRVFTQSSTPASGNSYAWTGTVNNSTSTHSIDGVVSRTNLAANPRSVGAAYSANNSAVVNSTAVTGLTPSTLSGVTTASKGMKVSGTGSEIGSWYNMDAQTNSATVRSIGAWFWASAAGYRARFGGTGGATNFVSLTANVWTWVTYSGYSGYVGGYVERIDGASANLTDYCYITGVTCLAGTVVPASHFDGTTDDDNQYDLWIDTTSALNTPKRWNGSTWATVTDKVATDALSTANNKTKTYFQTAQPGTTGNTTGDTWFDTDDGNKVYVWNGSAWATARDSGISAAQTSADGKNKIYYQITQPSGGTYIEGDTWFDTDDGNKIYVHNGTTWVASTLGSSAIADLAITNAKIADATIQSAKIGSVDAGTITVGTLSAARIGADTITASHIASDAITANELAANSITAAKGQISDAAITTAKIADAQITTAKIANLAVTDAQIAAATITNAKIANLDAAKITTGTLSADRIGANTISTLKLMVSDTTNLVEDAELGGNGWYKRSGVTTASTLVTTTGLPGRSWKLDGVGTEVSVATLSYFSVDPGAQYYISIKAQNALTGTNASAYFRIYWFTETGAAVSGTPENGFTIGVSGWATFGGTVTAPATARRGVFTAIHGSTATGGSWWFGLPAVRRKNEGSLIVDGAIAANSAIIANGAIGTAQIGDAQITTAKIANLAVTDAQIAAATITNAKIANLDAAKITTGTLDANRIGAKTITAEKLTIGRGANLYVDEDIIDTAAYSTTAYADAQGTGKSGKGSILLPIGSTQNGVYYAVSNTADHKSKRARLIPGSSYRIGAWVYTSANAPINSISLYLRCYKESDNTYAFSTPTSVKNTAIVTANTWTWVSGMVTVPANSDNIGGVLGFYKESTYTTGSTRFSDPFIQQAAGGELIVDGAIQAGSAIIGTGAIGTAQIGDAQITTAKINDLAVTDAKISTIDAGKITTGYLSAGRIDAGTIGAEKLLVSNSTNVLPDPSFLVTNMTNARLTASTGGIAGWTVNAGTSTGLRYLRRTTTTTNDSLHLAPFTNATGKQAEAIQVEAGQKWLLSVDVETDISAGVRFNVYRYFADGTSSYVSASGYSTAVGRRNLSYIWTVPSGVIAFYPALACNVTGTIWTIYGNGFVGQQAKATLIEDGAITTSHMTANTIDASVITAGTITAPKIAAKSIGVDKLTVSSSDNLIVEANFEHPTTPGSSWTRDSTKVMQPTGGRFGSAALRLTGTVSTNTSYNLNNQIVVDQDARFRVNMWVKTNVAYSSDKIRLGVKPYSGATAGATVTLFSNSSNAASANYVAGNDTYALISGVTNPLPANTTAVEFYVSSVAPSTTAYVDIDSVSVTRASEGTLIVDGSITAAKMEAELVLATKIVAGDPAGTHAEMSPQGFRVYADAAEVGAPSTEVVRLGVADTNDYFAITKADGSLAASISQDGVISGSTVYATDDIYYKGESLSTQLARLPRGPLYKAELSSDVDNITSNYGLVEGEFISDGTDRQIQFDFGIKLFPTAGMSEVYLKLMYTVDGSAPTVNSPVIFDVSLGTHASASSFDYKSFTHTIRPTTMNAAFLTPGTRGRFLMVIMRGNGDTLRPRAGLQTFMYITDIGPGIPHIPNFSPGGGSNPAPPPPVPAQQTYVRQYGCYNSMNYQGNNNQYNYDLGRMYQGLSPAGYGNLKSIGLFDRAAIQADLSGASINYVRVYFYFAHWYYNSGGTARIGVHNHTGIPGTFSSLGPLSVISGGWPKPGARWVDLSSSHWEGWKNGYGGVYLEGDSSYTTYGYADRPTLEISYTK